MSVDYFGKYFNQNGFNFTALINDDLFEPVKLLFNNRRYVSASKLLLIAIDTMSYIEYGDVRNPPSFVRWLNEYSDIENLGISADELWEHRNALLHTSGLKSRKVEKGEVRSLVAYVGKIPSEVKLNTEHTGYYELYELILVTAEAVGKWCKTYDVKRDKIHEFVKRYDEIASDARMQHIPLK